jgi:hypothetical protein
MSKNCICCLGITKKRRKCFGQIASTIIPTFFITHIAQEMLPPDSGFRMPSDLTGNWLFELLNDNNQQVYKATKLQPT